MLLAWLPSNQRLNRICPAQARLYGIVSHTRAESFVRTVEIDTVSGRVVMTLGRPRLEWEAESIWPGSAESFIRTVETDTLYSSSEQLKHIHCINAGCSGNWANSDILHCWFALTCLCCVALWFWIEEENVSIYSLYWVHVSTSLGSNILYCRYVLSCTIQ